MVTLATEFDIDDVYAGPGCAALGSVVRPRKDCFNGRSIQCAAIARNGNTVGKIGIPDDVRFSGDFQAVIPLIFDEQACDTDLLLDD